MRYTGVAVAGFSANGVARGPAKIARIIRAFPRVFKSMVGFFNIWEFVIFGFFLFLQAFMELISR